jgi:hypothetical protein
LSKQITRLLLFFPFSRHFQTPKNRLLLLQHVRKSAQFNEEFLRVSFFSPERLKSTEFGGLIIWKVFAGHRKYFRFEETKKLLAGTCRTQENRKKTAKLLLYWIIYVMPKNSS